MKIKKMREKLIRRHNKKEKKIAEVLPESPVFIATRRKLIVPLGRKTTAQVAEDLPTAFLRRNTIVKARKLIPSPAKKVSIAPSSLQSAITGYNIKDIEIQAIKEASLAIEAMVN